MSNVRISAWVVVGLLLAGAGCNSRASSEPAPNKALYSAIRSHLEKGAQETGPAVTAVAAKPTGWATLKGTFKVDGDPGPGAALKVDKDMTVCAPGGKTVLNNDVIVGPNKGLANVLIYLASKTGEGWIKDGAGSKAPPPYDQKDCIFLNRVFVMQSNQTLKILNSDPVEHNTKLETTGSAIPFNSIIPPRGSVNYTPGGAEDVPFPVSCSIHGWMKAWMITRDNPYFAVTKEDGSFEIKDLPAGVDLEFRVWHESTKVESVTLNGSEATWAKGKYKVKLTDGKDETIDVTLPAKAFKR